VFDRTAPELAKVAGYLSGGDRNRAEDLLQQTWLTAITRASTVGRRTAAAAVAARRARQPRAFSRCARSVAAVPGADVLETLLATDDPVRSSSDGEFAQLLQKALVELPSPFREAVTLHVEHGLTAVEIGRALGRPAGTVRTQIVRGLDRLRALLPVGLASLGVAAVLTAEQLLARASYGARRGRWRRQVVPVGERLVRWSGGLLLTAAVGDAGRADARGERGAAGAAAGSPGRARGRARRTPLDEPREARPGVVAADGRSKLRWCRRARGASPCTCATPTNRRCRPARGSASWRTTTCASPAPMRAATQCSTTCRRSCRTACSSAARRSTKTGWCCAIPVRSGTR
jgi:RNA polymerase sigma factor (sigma-70 family)